MATNRERSALIQNELIVLNMAALTLDQLGELHTALRVSLERVRTALVVPMRLEREKGATLLDLQTRSGYTSATSVQQILRPARREANRKGARERYRGGVEAEA